MVFKNSLIWILAILAISNFSYAQTLKGKVTYQATIVESYDAYPVIEFPDYLPVNTQLVAENSIPINFYLLFDDDESIYKSQYDMEETRKKGLLLNQTNIMAKQSTIYYSNFKTGEKYFQDYWTSHVLVNSEDIDWKLTTESKKIGDYTCFKATTQINSEQTVGMNFINPVTAWYTPEISVPFGIQSFVGLPGLIIELVVDYEYAKVQYKAIEFDLNPSREVLPEKPEGDERISEKEYVKMVKELNSRR